ncbi:MAG: hypothetical protein FD165_2415 [Gammaproteobacteria bacterium]|nr:MAG: hypothetical protein FD165_2415 [Gammaproteobacteria bacterium]TND03671.1 MAG: hypothetical protein FD120_1827 [Gammaproteobacteria bacterium]
MAISGTALSLYSPGVTALRAEQRFNAAQPVVVPVKQTGARSSPQKEKVLEGELIEQPFRTGNTTETIFSRAFVEGSFDYQASGNQFREVRSGRQAVAAYLETTNVDPHYGNASNRLVDFFV